MGNPTHGSVWEVFEADRVWFAVRRTVGFAFVNPPKPKTCGAAYRNKTVLEAGNT